MFRSSAASSRAFCARCSTSVGVTDDTQATALLSGIFGMEVFLP